MFLCRYFGLGSRWADFGMTSSLQIFNFTQNGILSSIKLSMSLCPPHAPKRSALILYGSETGNAQEVAEELGALAERLHFVTQVSELNHFHPVRSTWSISPGRELIPITGTAEFLLPHNIRRFYHRPGRSPRKRENILEIPAAETTPPDLPCRCQFRVVWSGR